MSLSDPTITDTRSMRIPGAGLVGFWVFVFGCAFVATFFYTEGERLQAQFSDLENALRGWGAPLVGIVGFIVLVIGGPVVMRVKGAMSMSIAALALGAALGLHWGSGAESLRQASGDVRKLVGVAAVAILVGLLGLARQARRARLVRTLIPHQAVIHRQGYTEATWEGYSGTTATVVLKFIDAEGRERFVQRRLTQYRADPLPEGTEIAMYWNPAEPENTSQMVFERQLHRRVEYF